MLAAATVLAGQASSFVQPLSVRAVVPRAAQLTPAMIATAAAAEPEPALLTLLEEPRRVHRTLTLTLALALTLTLPVALALTRT